MAITELEAQKTVVWIYDTIGQLQVNAELAGLPRKHVEAALIACAAKSMARRGVEVASAMVAAAEGTRLEYLIEDGA